jgi:hypothetical protein
MWGGWKVRGILTPKAIGKIKIIFQIAGTPAWIFGANKKLLAEAKKKIQDAMFKVPVGNRSLRADNPSPYNLSISLNNLSKEYHRF